MNTHDDIDRELRQAIRSYGSGVQPAERLGAIRARTQGASPAGARTGWGGGPWLLAGGAGVLAAAVIAAAVVLAPSPEVTGGEPPVAAPSERAMSVYYVTGGTTPAHLARERVTAEDTGDPGLDAVRAMLATRPADPDYVNGYDLTTGSGPITGVNAVTETDGVITVDFTQSIWDPYPTVDCVCPDSATVIQQAVWTAQEALGSQSPVAFTVDGRPARGIWLEPTPRPVQADPAALAPILIDSPADGATVSSAQPVRVSGTSDTFEANVAWEVQQGDEVVEQGSTMGGSYGKRRPFRFSVQLAPGDYTIRAYELSAEDGSVRAEDTKDVTVE